MYRPADRATKPTIFSGRLRARIIDMKPMYASRPTIFAISQLLASGGNDIVTASAIPNASNSVSMMCGAIRIHFALRNGESAMDNNPRATKLATVRYANAT